MGLAVNPTDERKDLLRLLVSQHELHGGEEFLLVRSMTGPPLGRTVQRVRPLRVSENMRCPNRNWHSQYSLAQASSVAGERGNLPFRVNGKHGKFEASL